MSEQLQYSDRYSALGIKPGTCSGPCEGTGFYPHRAHLDMKVCEYGDREDGMLCDGWHFVSCHECDGTGNKPQLVTG